MYLKNLLGNCRHFVFMVFRQTLTFLIAIICHSITHRYTFAVWLVRRSTNYSLHRPPQASQLTLHLPALSQRSKAFQNVIHP